MCLQNLPGVAYVDDPKLFLGIKSLMPTLELVQDGFHLIDRFSRAIPATNTLKGGWWVMAMLQTVQ